MQFCVSFRRGRKLLGIAAASLILSLVSWTSTASSYLQQSFPLACRGGDSMEFLYMGALNEVHVTFKRGTRPGSAGVVPGTCTWMDRGIGPNEPSTFCHRVDRFNVSWKAGGEVRISSAEGAYLTRLMRGQTSTLEAFNDPNSNPRCLRVTNVHSAAD